MGKFDCSTQLSALGCALTQGRVCPEALRLKFNFFYKTTKYSYFTHRHLYGSMLVWGKKLVVPSSLFFRVSESPLGLVATAVR